MQKHMRLQNTEHLKDNEQVSMPGNTGVDES